MARIIVIGGGIAGLSSAMLLARDGHDVTLLERDPAEPPRSPDDAWHQWERRGVNQFRQIHYFLPRFRQIVEAELPEIASELDAWGALRFNLIKLIPEHITGGWRDGDEQYTALTARRPVTESVLASCAQATSGLDVRRGVAVAGLLTSEPSNGIPHVNGVRTESGEELRADLVIEAGGRRSALPSYLEATGARAPEEEKEDSGFIYYGRHFRSADGSVPAMIAPILAAWGTISTLTLPADNGTWGVGIVTSAGDAALRALKDTDAWMRLWKSLALVAHWADGEPIDGGKVAVMAKIEDRHRAFVVDGSPVATGVFAVGDSWACTNPSVGRGASIGLMHAVALRDYLRDAPLGDPVASAKGWHDVTQATVQPYYDSTLTFDRQRLGEINAWIEGKPYECDDPSYELTHALQHASTSDPDLFRAFMKIAGALEDAPEVLGDPVVFEKAVTHGAGWREAPTMAPTRDELLATVKG
jgi:2-polyprenyl-6-methoxyphenol hydroxylase-like FAD-dependent oxidoreductase